MKKRIKAYLFRLLGEENYLKLLNRGFFFLYNTGLLKSNEEYKYHYYAKQLIKKGDTVVDIGANLGYYTKLYSKWVGDNGKVIAIEPVPLYNKIIKWACNGRKNITLYPYALGKEDKKVHLVTPDHFGYLRTGLPHIYDEKNNKALSEYEFSFEADMKKAKELFERFDKIDFLKCDIEGYEEVVIPEILPVLKKFKPTIQIETWGEHKPVVEAALNSAGFEKYYLTGSVLKKAVAGQEDPAGDLIFIHKDKQL
ncbi:MAG TPA: FkbM family methyltransferase [Chitinophagaceae bacterium]|nr:FkbM family methyltransferase [Chitinophagaceae bacterium]